MYLSDRLCVVLSEREFYLLDFALARERHIHLCGGLDRAAVAFYVHQGTTWQT